MFRETDDTFAVLSNQPGYQQAALVREQARALISTLGDMRHSYGAMLLPGYVHGDYGGDNVLMAHDAIVAILDFDFMAYRERIFDIAYGLYWALYRFCERQNGEVTPLRCIGQASSALAHYNRHAPIPLNEHEIMALPWEMARIPLFWLAEAGYLGESEADATPLRQTVRFAEHLTIARQLINNAALLGQRFRQALV